MFFLIFGLFVGFPGDQLPVFLFMLVPFMPLVEDGGEGYDDQKGDQQDKGVKIRGIGLHIGSLVPAGGKVDDNGDDEQEPDGDPDQELPEYLLAAVPVVLPIDDKCLLFRGQHR